MLYDSAEGNPSLVWGLNENFLRKQLLGQGFRGMSINDIQKGEVVALGRGTGLQEAWFSRETEYGRPVLAGSR